MKYVVIYMVHGSSMGGGWEGPYRVTIEAVNDQDALDSATTMSNRSHGNIIAIFPASAEVKSNG